MPDDSVPDAVPDESPAPPHRRRHIRVAAGAIAAVLLALLGFAIAVQVHQNSGSDNLSNLREDDLISILDDQNSRADRLRQQIGDLESTLRRLQGSGDRAAAARAQAKADVQALGVLLGTVAAHGTGVRVTVTDPKHALHAEDLLDVVEELRGAGAEAIQFGTARVSTSTAFTDDGDSVAVDGIAQTAPYTVLAIGAPKTLDTALNIPGGVAASVRADGGELTVSEQQRVSITATRTLTAPRYASPSGK